MTLIIAGDRSSSGKTTVTLALLSYLQQQGERVQSFKVGPDYIDPMFHGKITGRPCRNLDPILTNPDYVKSCFAHHSQSADYAVVEGVMGLFDGIGQTEAPSHVPKLPGCPAIASTAHLARLLQIPVLLVIDCCSLSGSVAAIAQGYRALDPQLEIAGVILNRVGSERHLELLNQALAPLAIPVLGVLFRNADLVLPDRHLGLVPTDELPELPQFFARLAQRVQGWDWSRLLPLLKSLSNQNRTTIQSECLLNPRDRVREGLKPSPTVEGQNLTTNSVGWVEAQNLKTGRSGVGFCWAQPNLQAGQSIPIAIARDRAFNFYYADNLDLLSLLGAQLIPWSPLADPLPDRVQGVLLGGGFPELFATELAANQRAMEGLRAAIARGLPVYAECGGLMYLCAAITTFKGQTWPMVGIFPPTVKMGGKLTLGYRRAIAQRPSLIAPASTVVWGHEFHRSVLTQLPDQPLWQSQGLARQAQPYLEGWQYQNVYATYLHLHWATQCAIPQQFLQRAQAFDAAA
ncbi:MAG: cobyrinate a,c-diamide synthase [Cyanobacteria bacterium P01_G01_bin.54]